MPETHCRQTHLRGMKTILVTGSSGLIGSAIVRSLKDKYEIHGLDRIKPESAPDIPTTLADIHDFETIRPAFEGMDAVVHLAADPDLDAEWDSVLYNNIVPAYNVFECAARAGVRRVVFASSNRAVGMWELEGAAAKIRVGDYSGLEPGGFPRIDDKVRTRPDSFYGISKAFGEVVGAYYADNRGLEVACLRIGRVTHADDPTEDIRMRATWLSHRDAAHLVDCCLSAPELGFDIFYGVSNNTWRYWDIEHAKKTIGYDPQDNAENYWRDTDCDMNGKGLEDLGRGEDRAL